MRVRLRLHQHCNRPVILCARVGILLDAAGASNGFGGRDRRGCSRRRRGERGNPMPASVPPSLTPCPSGGKLQLR
eukprot:6907040-Prymnesium_polylepis.2